ncbi:MAG: protein kinase domain-containing protein [Pyrinomonadaceae bacterium]
MTSEQWQELKRIFNDAAERAPAEQSAFVAEACAGDLLLLAEVEALLACQIPAADFIEDSAFDVAARVVDKDDLVGARVGSYRLVRELGHGGMGVVYEAVRADDQFDQQVAVKVIKRGMDSEAILRRFVMERQILANLDHPNIARLLDGGTTNAGLPYFIMEFIDGEPLDEYADARKLSTAERLKLFQRICAAVSYAHRNLVVHRDLKPSNILVAGEGVPKLLDFGIAKLLQSAEAAHSIEQTGTQMRAMTPEYASPEQISGLPVTTLSDVYSLGVLLYELLTGRRPYYFKSRAPQEIAAAILTQEPERPSVAVSHTDAGAQGTGGKQSAAKTASRTRADTHERLSRRLRGDLDTIVLTALRKEPERRYGSVEQLSEDIRRHLEGLPVTARKDTFRYRAEKFMRRHARETVAAAFVLLALTAGLAVATWQARVARRERTVAERRFDDVRRLANAVVFKYHDAIENLPGATRARQMLVSDALEYLDSLTQAAGDKRELQGELATAYVKIGDVQGQPGGSSLGDKQGALASYRRALSLRETLLAAEPKSALRRRAVAEGEERIGGILAGEGQLEEALALFKRALATRESLAQSNASDSELRRELAGALILIGQLRGNNGGANLGDPAGARVQLGKGINLLEAIAHDEGDPARQAREDLSDAYMAMSNVLDTQGDFAGALDNSRKALSLEEARIAAEPLNTRAQRNLANAHLKVADALYRFDKFDEALGHVQRSRSILERMATADPYNAAARRDLAIAHQRAGRMLLGLGQLPESLSQQRQALMIHETLAAAEPANAEWRFDLAIQYGQVGLSLEDTNDLDGALESYLKCVRLMEEMRISTPADMKVQSYLAENYNNIGNTLMGKRDAAGALDYYRRALAIYEQLSAPNPSDAFHRRAVAVLEMKVGNSNMKLAETSLAAKNAVQRLGHWRAARDHHRRSLDIFLDIHSRNQIASDADTSRIDQIRQSLAKCDTALAR